MKKWILVLGVALTSHVSNAYDVCEERQKLEAQIKIASEYFEPTEATSIDSFSPGSWTKATENNVGYDVVTVTLHRGDRDSIRKKYRVEAKQIGETDDCSITAITEISMEVIPVPKSDGCLVSFPESRFICWGLEHNNATAWLLADDLKKIGYRIACSSRELVEAKAAIVLKYWSEDIGTDPRGFPISDYRVKAVAYQGGSKIGEAINPETGSVKWAEDLTQILSDHGCKP